MKDNLITGILENIGTQQGYNAKDIECFIANGKGNYKKIKYNLHLVNKCYELIREQPNYKYSKMFSDLAKSANEDYIKFLNLEHIDLFPNFETEVRKQTIYEAFYDWVFIALDECTPDEEQWRYTDPYRIIKLFNWKNKSKFLFGEYRRYKRGCSEYGSEPICAVWEEKFYLKEGNRYVGNMDGVIGYLCSIDYSDDKIDFLNDWVSMQPEPIDDVDIFAEENMGWLE